MFLKFAMSYAVSIYLLFCLHVAEAVEPLSTAELASHCSHYKKEPSGVDAAFCVRYIQGFIDGAIAADKKVAQNTVTKLNKETFSERVMRTRKARQKSVDPDYLAKFCLGTPVPLKSVVEKIIANFNQRKHNSKEIPARDAVYYVLRNEYPCNKQKIK